MHGSLEAKMPADKIYERMTADLPINSQVAPAVVDDPYEPGSKSRVLRSVRDDMLAALAARGQIDQAQYDAGREWQKYHSQSEIGGISAIDPGKEAVDGGRMPEPITDRKIDAFRKLNESRQCLGVDGYELVSSILAHHNSITEAATIRKLGSKDGRAYVGRRFRECLECLAVLWGHAMAKR